MNGPFALPSNHIIKKRREFLRVQRFGARSFGKHVVVVAKISAHDDSKFGITVPKKVGNAAVRNKIKRRIRSIFRTNKFLYANKNLVIIAKDSIAQESFALLKTDIELAVKRLQLKLSSRSPKYRHKYSRVA